MHRNKDCQRNVRPCHLVHSLVHTFALGSTESLPFLGVSATWRSGTWRESAEFPSGNAFLGVDGPCFISRVSPVRVRPSLFAVCDLSGCFGGRAFWKLGNTEAQRHRED